MKNNPNHNIYIFTGPAHTGKTRRLQQWLAGGIQAAGILTPEVKGKQMLYDIGRNKYHAFEVDETYGGEKIMIGQLLFAKNAFLQGREVIANPGAATGNWLIIDEVGKLEIEQGEGWEPMILRMVAAYKNNTFAGNLLLVVRDSLLEKALEKYELRNQAVLLKQLPG